MGTEVFSPGINWPGHGTDHSLFFLTLRISGGVPPLSVYAFLGLHNCRYAYVKKDNESAGDML